MPLSVGHLGVEPKTSGSQSPRASYCTSTRLFQLDELGVEPSRLDCKSKRRPDGKPKIKAARVGFEPDLSGLKNQRPHQKSNEPYYVCGKR